MTPRVAVVALIALATVGFFVGTTIERNSGDSHTAGSAVHVGSAPAGETGGEAGEEAGHSDEGGRTAEPALRTEASEKNGELRPLGIDVEAAPFVALAALGSLALALLVWFRADDAKLLIAVAAAMTLFGLLDIREVVHQADEGNAGLAVIAAVIAGLHLSAAFVAALMARGPTSSSPPLRTGPSLRPR